MKKASTLTSAHYQAKWALEHRGMGAWYTGDRTIYCPFLVWIPDTDCFRVFCCQPLFALAYLAGELHRERPTWQFP